VAMALVIRSSAPIVREPAEYTASIRLFWSRRGLADERAPGKRMTFVDCDDLDSM
jgi:hypothetical protein